MSLNLEQARPLLEKHAVHELIDPRLSNCYSEPEVHNMLQCALSCIQQDPHSRPRMSQVTTKVLENELHFYIGGAEAFVGGFTYGKIVACLSSCQYTSISNTCLPLYPIILRDEQIYIITMSMPANRKEIACY